MGISRRLLPATLALVAIAALAGCATGPRYSASDATVRSTPRSLAAATIDYLGHKARFAEPTYISSYFPKGSYGTEVHLTAKGEKYIVRVVVSSRPAKYQIAHCPSKPGIYDGCTEQKIDGHTQILTWQLIEPEEDPGILEITSFRTHEVVTLAFYGPDIKKSPLKGGIPIEVSRLERLASSPVVGFRTTPDYVKEGDALATWRSGVDG